MARDPYAPPKSEVKDVEAERLLAGKPRQVVYAVFMLWTSLVIGIPLAYFDHQRSTLGEAEFVFLPLTVLVFALAVALNIFIGRGHNWARIVYLLLTIVAFFFIASTVEETLTYSTIEIALEVVTLALDVVALYLLFTRPGALWFKPSA